MLNDTLGRKGAMEDPTASCLYIKLQTAHARGNLVAVISGRGREGLRARSVDDIMSSQSLFFEVRDI